MLPRSMGAKWGGDGVLEIALLNGNVGERWGFAAIGPQRRQVTVFYTRFTIVAGGLFIVADPVFYCRKPPKTLSLAPLKTVAERIFTAFFAILLMKLWYVPQFERGGEKYTFGRSPKTSLKPDRPAHISRTEIRIQGPCRRRDKHLTLLKLGGHLGAP